MPEPGSVSVVVPTLIKVLGGFGVGGSGGYTPAEYERAREIAREKAGGEGVPVRAVAQWLEVARRELAREAAGPARPVDRPIYTPPPSAVTPPDYGAPIDEGEVLLPPVLGGGYGLPEYEPEIIYPEADIGLPPILGGGFGVPVFVSPFVDQPSPPTRRPPPSADPRRPGRGGLIAVLGAALYDIYRRWEKAREQEEERKKRAQKARMQQRRMEDAIRRRRENDIRAWEERQRLADKVLIKVPSRIRKRPPPPRWEPQEVRVSPGIQKRPMPRPAPRPAPLPPPPAPFRIPPWLQTAITLGQIANVLGAVSRDRRSTIVQEPFFPPPPTVDIPPAEPTPPDIVTGPTLPDVPLAAPPSTIIGYLSPLTRLSSGLVESADPCEVGRRYLQRQATRAKSAKKRKRECPGKRVSYCRSW